MAFSAQSRLFFFILGGFSCRWLSSKQTLRIECGLIADSAGCFVTLCALNFASNPSIHRLLFFLVDLLQLLLGFHPP